MHRFLGTVVGLALIGGAAQARPLSLDYLGITTIASGTQFAGTTVGGLSGIDYNAATGSYTAIADDRSQINPARFYNFDLNYNRQGFNSATPTATTTIKQPNGSTIPALGADPESIRHSPTGTLVWSSEGDGAQLQAPAVREMNADGSYVRDFVVPTRYNPTADNSSGIRNNLAFESLTYSPNGKNLFTATEGALYQDGPQSTPTNGSTARILKYDVATGLPVAEYAYALDPVADAPIPAGQFTVNGLVEMLALSSTEFLAVERSFSIGVGYTIKLYQFSIDGATDVSGIDSLAGGGFTGVEKTLLLDLGELGITLDNIEGITFGKTLENGRRSLVLVSDNNFTPGVATQLLAFEVAGVPEPDTWALMLIGFGASGFAMRRRQTRVVAS